jgi:hypothetical protein
MTRRGAKFGRSYAVVPALLEQRERFIAADRFHTPAS